MNFLKPTEEDRLKVQDSILSIKQKYAALLQEMQDLNNLLLTKNMGLSRQDLTRYRSLGHSCAGAAWQTQIQSVTCKIESRILAFPDAWD